MEVSEMEKCDFGIFLNEECNKTYFTSKFGLRELIEIGDIGKALYCRAGMGVNLADGDVQ